MESGMEITGMKAIALARLAGGGGGDVTVEALNVTENGTYTAPSGTAYSPVTVDVGVKYGFHINSNESDPAACVTYLADAVGMTPAHMDYTHDVFDYGGWRDAFFLPRPCMLKYDGTVDYYLDPDDYSKKADGSASDVADDTYGGNAMMEWGRNGKKIWYKIVPDSGDSTSASVYIADYRADEDFRAWSFINNQGDLVEHFYTPIYNGSIDAGGKLRSISGKTYEELCQGKTAEQEVEAAELNNPSTDAIWYTEVFADVTLINLLLILMGKSLNTQAVYGDGYCAQSSDSSSKLGTGTMNDKGLFWGKNNAAYGVKIFGMENWWGNLWRRYAGHMTDDHVHKYKLTRGTQDGSTANGYNTDATGYLTGTEDSQASGYVGKMWFDANCFFPKTVGGSTSTYWSDYYYQNSNSGLRYTCRGGIYTSNRLSVGSFYFCTYYTKDQSNSNIGAAPSAKPLADSEAAS